MAREKRPGKMLMPEQDFIRMFEELGAAGLAVRTELPLTAIFKRRQRLERKYGKPIVAPDQGSVRPKEYPGRLTQDIPNGTAIIFSDCHYWPGTRSLMHRALLEAIKEFKPSLVIANGDVIDAPTISKHASIGWENDLAGTPHERYSVLGLACCCGPVIPL